jgi:hypothetical protein
MKLRMLLLSVLLATSWQARAGSVTMTLIPTLIPSDDHVDAGLTVAGATTGFFLPADYITVAGGFTLVCQNSMSAYNMSASFPFERPFFQQAGGRVLIPSLGIGSYSASSLGVTNTGACAQCRFKYKGIVQEGSAFIVGGSLGGGGPGFNFQLSFKQTDETKKAERTEEQPFELCAPNLGNCHI